MDNLVSVELPSGMFIEYAIDGLGRRVGKKLNGSLVRQWLYGKGPNPVAELNGVGGLVAQFVYASKTNVPDYVRRGTTNYRVISDQLGSPLYVVDIGNANNVPYRATYSAFGVAVGASLDRMPFGFAGGIFDPDTNLVHFGARDYDPLVGRWTSKDPILFASNDTNLYGYVRNNPVDGNDSSGTNLDGYWDCIRRGISIGSCSQDEAENWCNSPFHLFCEEDDANDEPTPSPEPPNPSPQMCPIGGPPSLDRCLDACSGGQPVLKAFCNSIPDASTRARCWRNFNENEQTCRNWCWNEFSN